MNVLKAHVIVLPCIKELENQKSTATISCTQPLGTTIGNTCYTLRIRQSVSEKRLTEVYDARVPDLDAGSQLYVATRFAIGTEIPMCFISVNSLHDGTVRLRLRLRDAQLAVISEIM